MNLNKNEKMCSIHFFLQVSEMKFLISLLALCLVGQQGAHAWGGLFNRFSPEMLANMGYGSHGGYIQVSNDDK